MKSLTLFILSIIGMSVAFAEVNPVAKKDAFVIKREKFSKPLIWIKPKPDKNKQVPTDVFCQFMENINSRKYAEAMASCIPFTGFGAEPDPEVRSILNERLFPRFVDKVLRSAGDKGEVIRISEYAIKGKGGWWRVEYKFEGQLRMLDFRKTDGVWKIHEQPSWHGNVVRDPSQALGGFTFS